MQFRRKATFTEISKYYRDNFYECRIAKEGEHHKVSFRASRDHYPNASRTWLDGGYSDDYKSEIEVTYDPH